VLPNKILQSVDIFYRLKHNEEEVIKVRGFGVFWKKPGEDKMHRLDVYGDFEKVKQAAVQTALKAGQ
jgi:hypothetical protein